jgi:hypothetical protein
MVWRDHTTRAARAAMPQVVAFHRHVDATGYPAAILVQPDTLVLRFVGRDSPIH